MTDPLWNARRWREKNLPEVKSPEGRQIVGFDGTLVRLPSDAEVRAAREARWAALDGYLVDALARPGRRYEDGPPEDGTPEDAAP